jgi:hypothetical protein
MRDLHGVTLSEGAVAQVLERAGRKAEPAAETIKRQVITGRVVKSDETSARVEGRNWWKWVFISDDGVYHTIVPTRGASEVSTVMGNLRVEAWGCDCFGSQLKAPAKVFLLCLAHQLRDLQRVLDADPQGKWAGEMQKLFCSAIHLRKGFMRGRDGMTLRGFQGRVTQIENRLDSPLREPARSKAAIKLINRFTTRRNKLLNFRIIPKFRRRRTNRSMRCGAASSIAKRHPSQGDKRLSLQVWSQSLRQSSNHHCDRQAQGRGGPSDACGFNGNASSSVP